MRGRLIGPKTWDRIVGIFGAILDSPLGVDCLGCWVMIYALNHVLVSKRPGMAMEFGFTKWNRCWMVAVNSNSRVLLFT